MAYADTCPTKPWTEAPARGRSHCLPTAAQCASRGHGRRSSGGARERSLPASVPICSSNAYSNCDRNTRWPTRFRTRCTSFLRSWSSLGNRWQSFRERVRERGWSPDGRALACVMAPAVRIRRSISMLPRFAAWALSGLRGTSPILSRRQSLVHGVRDLWIDSLAGVRSRKIEDTTALDAKDASSTCLSLRAHVLRYLKHDRFATCSTTLGPADRAPTSVSGLWIRLLPSRSGCANR